MDAKSILFEFIKEGQLIFEKSRENFESSSLSLLAEQNSFQFDVSGKDFTKWTCKVQEFLKENFPEDYEQRFLKESTYTRITNNVFEQLLGILEFLYENSNNDMYKDKSKIKVKDSNKIFISHAYNDVKFIIKFVDFLENIGVSRNNIFCSSIFKNGVAPSQRAEIEIQKDLINDGIIIYILTEEFYKSPACLHELGAGWILQEIYKEKQIYLLKMPNLSHSNFKGMFNNTFQYITIQNLTDFIDHLLKTLNIESRGTMHNHNKANELGELANNLFIKDMVKESSLSIVDYSKAIRCLSKIEKIMIAKLYESDNWECNLPIKYCIELEAKKMIKMGLVSPPTADYRLTDEFIEFINANINYEKELLKVLIDNNNKY